MRILLALIVALRLASPLTADANPVCRWIGLCLYLSPGFAVIVVDAETDKLLPDVYGWAEWTQYGAHGRGGALMVQDATSGGDGRLAFPSWGPRLGSSGGVLLGYDPAVILFKAGYATLLVQNGVPLGASHHAAIRGMSRNGETLRLQPFRGSPVQWVEHLRHLVFPGLSSGVADVDRERFRREYLQRLAIVATQLQQLPPDLAEAAELRTGLAQSSRYFGDQQR